MKKILDKTFWLYVGLGILNYGFCSVIMLFFKNVVRLGDTPCLIISFTLQTSISFILNRFVTFRGHFPVLAAAVRMLHCRVLCDGKGAAEKGL